MSADREFYDAQDAKVKRAHERFKAEASSFSKCEQAGGSKDEMINRLNACHQAAREFFRELNDAVADPGPLTGKLFEQWKQNCVSSSVAVLSGLPRNQEKIRKHRDRLGIPGTNFEFSPGVFDNMQSIVAQERPEEARRLRDAFQAAGLPAGGFDRPRKIEPTRDEGDDGGDDDMNTEKTTPPKKEEPPKSSALSILTPGGAVEAARRAHPAFKFGIVVLGLAGVVTIGLRYGPSPATLIFGIIVVVVLMVLFFVFSQAVSMAHAGTPFSVQVQVLVWCYLFFAIAAPALLLSSAFIDKPWRIKTRIDKELEPEAKPAVEQKAAAPKEPPVDGKQTPFGASDREVKTAVPKAVPTQPRALTVDVKSAAIKSRGIEIVSLDPAAMADCHGHSISQDQEVVAIFYGRHWDQFSLFAFTWTTNENTGVQTPTCNGFVAYLPSNEDTHNAEIHTVTNVDGGVRVEILSGKNADIRSTFLWSRGDGSWKANANLKDQAKRWPEPTIVLERDNTISLLGDVNHRDTTLKACP